MSELILSIGAARALHLAAQDLATPRRRRAAKEDVLATIRRMRMLQIDTISVVARSPYLVLWSRLGDYDPAWLDALLADGHLFEYWAHEACFVPIEDYGLFRHRMLDPEAMGWKYSARWMREHAAEVALLLDHIRANGPVRAADFERTDGQVNGWWAWKPEKRSLEVLFTAGALMIARRHNFQPAVSMPRPTARTASSSYAASHSNPVCASARGWQATSPAPCCAARAGTDARASPSRPAFHLPSVACWRPFCRGNSLGLTSLVL